MRQIKPLLAAAALSWNCLAAPVAPAAEPSLYNVILSHAEADLCKTPAVAPEDRRKLIAAAMAVSTPGLVYDQIFSPLDYAVAADDPSSVRHLISVGYQLTTRVPPGGDTLLHLAAWHGAEKVALFLLDQGVDANATNDAGSTPLMVAASEGHLEMVRLLLAHGAEARARRPDGNTSLSYSMVCKNQLLVDVLLDAGAEIDQKSKILAQKFGLSLHDR